MPVTAAMYIRSITSETCCDWDDLGTTAISADHKVNEVWQIAID